MKSHRPPKDLTLYPNKRAASEMFTPLSPATSHIATIRSSTLVSSSRAPPPRVLHASVGASWKSTPAVTSSAVEIASSSASAVAPANRASCSACIVLPFPKLAVMTATLPSATSFPRTRA